MCHRITGTGELARRTSSAVHCTLNFSGFLTTTSDVINVFPMNRQTQQLVQILLSGSWRETVGGGGWSVVEEEEEGER